MTESKVIKYKDTKGDEKELVLFNSVRAVVTYNQAFGEQIFDALEKSDKDILIGIKLAYALAKPCLFGKVSFEEFCDTIPFDALVPISQEVVPFIAEVFEKESKEIAETKNL